MRFSFDLDAKDFRRNMAQLFEQLLNGLAEICIQGTWEGKPLPLIPGVQPYLREAWAEILESDRSAGSEVSRVFGAIETVEENRFARAGLTGRQLIGKLYILQNWSERARDGAIRSIIKVLENINAFLGSFVYATGAAEPIKELKEMIENAIDSFREAP